MSDMEVDAAAATAPAGSRTRHVAAVATSASWSASSASGAVPFMSAKALTTSGGGTASVSCAKQSCVGGRTCLGRTRARALGRRKTYRDRVGLRHPYMEQGLAAVLPHFFERVPRGPGQSFAHDLGRETILRGRDAVGVVYTVRDAVGVLGSHHSGCHLGGRAWHDVAMCDVARFEHAARLRAERRALDGGRTKRAPLSL